MSFSDEQLTDIYDRTDGRCHLCHKKLAFSNYGRLVGRGAWEVEHSNPKAKGGTNRLNNLYAACIACNRSKGAGSTRAARARNGKTKAPMSASKKASARRTNAAFGAAVGAAAGALVGKKAVLPGLILGAVIGHNQDPEE